MAKDMAKRRARQPAKKNRKPKFSIRIARGAGKCSRCGESYKKGDRLGGKTGEWFHERHLSPKELQAAYTARVASQSQPGRPLRGGSWESGRR